VEGFVEAVRREYAAKTGIDAQCFVSVPTDGAIALAAKGGVA
jgi:galactokinase